ATAFAFPQRRHLRRRLGGADHQDVRALPGRPSATTGRHDGGFGEAALRCASVLVAANWKMFKTRAETRDFCERFRPPDGVDVVVCPPFTSLEVAVGSGLTVYAQNVHWAREGAFTGEVAAQMLLELGVAGSLVGHSERRQYFGETDESVARRARAAL